MKRLGAALVLRSMALVTACDRIAAMACCSARHVHFGVAHVRHALAHHPTLAARLEAAVRRRAAALHGVGRVPARVQDALTLPSEALGRTAASLGAG